LPLANEPPVNLASSDGLVWAVPEETVWATPLLFTQHTFCPAVIVAVLGLNVNDPVAVMVALAPEPAQVAAPPPPPPYGDVELELPHDVSSNAPAIPDTSDNHVDRIGPPA
jgi:hypothetical protein